MKATIKLAGGARLIEVEGETQKDLFEGMGMAYEIFNETTCGLCGSTSIRPVVRAVEKFRFYEYQCMEPGCFAKLTFGQAQEGGGLFPKRKLLENGKPDLAEGTYGDHNGWTKYRGDNQEPSANAPKYNTPSNVPPAPAWTTLQNMLGDIGVSPNEAGFRDKVIQFVTRESGGKAGFGVSECVKDAALAEKAAGRLQSAIKFYGSESELLVKVQEWMKK